MAGGKERVWVYVHELTTIDEQEHTSWVGGIYTSFLAMRGRFAPLSIPVAYTYAH